MTLAQILLLPVQPNGKIVKASDKGTFFAIAAGESGADAVALVTCNEKDYTGTTPVYNLVGITEEGYDAIPVIDPNTFFPITNAKDRVYSEVISANSTLLAEGCYGKVYFVDSAAIVTLPPGVTGMSLMVSTIGAFAVSVKADATNLIYLDGVALDNGDKITNNSATGDTVVLFADAAGDWKAITDGWNDTGA